MQCTCVSISFMQGPEVRSGDVPHPILLKESQEFNFTIKRGVCTEDTVSVNYDDFVNDVEVGDIILVDGKCSCGLEMVNWYDVVSVVTLECLSFLAGGMMSLAVKAKKDDMVKCVVVDGGELKSRRHLNVRGKSATLPSITSNILHSSFFIRLFFLYIIICIWYMIYSTYFGRV